MGESRAKCFAVLGIFAHSSVSAFERTKVRSAILTAIVLFRNLMEGLQKTLNSTVEPGMNGKHGAGSYDRFVMLAYS